MYKMNYIKKRTPSCHPFPTILPKRQRKKIRAILQSFLIRVPGYSPSDSAKILPSCNPVPSHSPSVSAKKSVQSFNPF
jgi:hypothetical protein